MTDKRTKKNKTDKKTLENIAFFKEIVKEYNISEDTSNLKMVLEKLQERVEYYIKILLQILHPEEFHSLHECVIFNDEEKNKIFSIYKELMILHREIVKSIVKNDEKEMVLVLKKTHSEIKNIKPDILWVLEKMRDSWRKNISNGRVKYFG